MNGQQNIKKRNLVLRIVQAFALMAEGRHVNPESVLWPT